MENDDCLAMLFITCVALKMSAENVETAEHPNLLMRFFQETQAECQPRLAFPGT